MDPNTFSAVDLTDQKLLETIEAFLERSGMKPTVFGIEVNREGGLVKSIRDGRSVSVTLANQILSFIANWRPDSAGGAGGSPTKAAENIRMGESLADNLGGNIREPSQAIEDKGEADSRGPFSEGSPPTCSMTGEPQLMPLANPTSSSSRSKAA